MRALPEDLSQTYCCVHIAETVGKIGLGVVIIPPSGDLLGCDRLVASFSRRPASESTPFRAARHDSIDENCV
jgi:hypothetical protein